MHRARFNRIAATVVASLLIAAAMASVDPLADARTRFLDALSALDRGQLDSFRKIAGQLEDYPLYPYLEYRALRKRLNKASHAEMARFIERYADQPVGQRMRRAWLHALAKQHEWKDFLSVYTDNQSTRLQCYYLRARQETNDTENLVEDALPLWMVGHSQDKACDTIFKYLDRQGAFTRERVWERIRLAMQEGQPSLADYLAKRLPANDRKWVSAWRDARSRPASALTSKQLAADVPRAREIVLFALRRITRSDLDEAQEKWAIIKPRYDFDPEESAELERYMALRAAWRRHPQAHDWLLALPDTAVDEDVREWRARTAIADGLWDTLLSHIAQMPPEERQLEEWRYWEARAYQEIGATLQASNRFARLARERDYHGFLAADELAWPYEMDNRPLELDPADIKALAERPGFVRARELYRAEMWVDARREWRNAISDLSKEQIKQAAALAHQWGWHDQAILTVARAREFGDLELRFPLAHKDHVELHAGENKLDPGHVFAVIRQESAFNPDARSSAGARGLMQLMPSTGRTTARKYSIPLGGLHRLYEAAKNISIGTAYLNQVMEDYGRNIVLASAAYNAGPHRVKRWLPEEDKQEAERWVAMVPFDETRNYIQRVLAYSAIYDWRMQRPITTLDEHMPDIYPYEYYADK
ncbi:MAG: transglycosylase SLT domain-containing protein [Gammaproteobacteria bacterium]